MSGWHKTVGALMIGLSLLLAGCAVGPGGSRPMMAMDGQPFDLQDPVENGRALILTGQLGLAVDTLSRTVSDDPGNARALTLLAVAYGKLKRFDLADRYHAEALEADPVSVAALNNWGYSYLVRGDRTRATDLLARAAVAGAGRPIVAANLALARGAEGGGEVPVFPASINAAAATSVRLSEHVTLVRPTGRLVRVAPGVQLLRTAGQGPAMVAAADPPAAMTDTRFALFRALSALLEEESGRSDATADQVAAVAPAAAPSPFGYFPDVDDFARQ